MARSLRVEIVGDPSNLRKALGSAGKSADSFGSRMERMGRVVAKASLYAGAAVAGGLVVTLKRGFDELAESQKVMAQTAATLKSTGGVANVTAKEIEGLASSLSAMTGIDDEAIQANENLLLTFKNVRDEVGKGNDIFKQATQASLDLSTAGFGSLDSAAKMMGKALNDPIKGMTALGRAGVTFSEDQKKAIEALTKTGDLLGAQKIILKEVESQVGGSAKAYGETFPGQMAKLRNSFDEVAGQLAGVFVPALARGAEGLASFLNKIGKAEGFQAKVRVVWEGIQSIGQKVISAVQAIPWGEVWASAKVSAAGLLDRFHIALQNADWARIGALIGKATGESIKFAAKLAVILTTEFMKAAREVDWKAVSKAFAKGLFDSLKVEFEGYSVKNVPANVKEMAGSFLDALESIQSPLNDGGEDAGKSVTKGFTAGIERGNVGAVQTASAAGRAAGAAYTSGATAAIYAAVSAAIAAVQSFVRSMVSAGQGELKARSPSKVTEEKIGKPFIEGAILGMLRMGPQLDTAARDRIKSAVQAMASTIESLKASIEGPWEKVRQIIAAKIAAAGGAIDQARLAEKMQAQLDKLAASVEAKKEILRAAFDRMAGDALRAFDARTTAGLAAIDAKLAAKLSAIATKLSTALAGIAATQGELTPGEQALAAAQAAIAAEGLAKALAAAKAALAGASAGVGFEPKEGETPEDAAARQAAQAAAILAAQQQLVEAERAIALAALAEQAARERKAADDKAERARKAAEAAAERAGKREEKEAARETLEYQAKRDRLKRNLEDWLADQEALLERSPKQWAAVHKKLMAKFKKEFGPDYETAGYNLGAAFAKGMTESMEAMESAAEKLAKLIAKYLKTASPTELGPLSDLDTWAKGFAPAWASGLDTDALTSSMSGVGNGSRTTSNAAGSVIVHSHVYLDGRQIYENVERRQFRKLSAGGAIPSNA